MRVVYWVVSFVLMFANTGLLVVASERHNTLLVIGALIGMLLSALSTLNVGWKKMGPTGYRFVSWIPGLLMCDAVVTAAVLFRVL